MPLPNKKLTAYYRDINRIKQLQEQQAALVTKFLGDNIQFKEWIEQTSLFHAIVTDAKLMGIIRIHESNGSVTDLKLNGKQITKAEELPPEILVDFFINSPWFKTDLSKNKNLLTDESSEHSI